MLYSVSQMLIKFKPAHIKQKQKSTMLLKIVTHQIIIINAEHLLIPNPPPKATAKDFDPMAHINSYEYSFSIRN